MARSFVPSVVQKLSELGVFLGPSLVCWRVRIWMTVFCSAASMALSGYGLSHVDLSPWLVRLVIYNAAACSESVDPKMLQYASKDKRSVISRRMVEKFEMTPLCMKTWRPKTKGCELTCVTTLPLEARICAKTQWVSVFWQRDLKLKSLIGGDWDLYSAGRGPVTCLMYEAVASVYPEMEVRGCPFNYGVCDLNTLRGLSIVDRLGVFIEYVQEVTCNVQAMPKPSMFSKEFRIRSNSSDV